MLYKYMILPAPPGHRAPFNTDHVVVTDWGGQAVFCRFLYKYMILPAPPGHRAPFNTDHVVVTDWGGQSVFCRFLYINT